MPGAMSQENMAEAGSGTSQGYDWGIPTAVIDPLR
jgi:hypothetical protein